jgi:hypothetical protein
MANTKNKPILKLMPQVFTYIKENKIKVNRLDIGLPWLTKSAVRFLDDFVVEGIRVFEFGSGASTVYFSKKGVKLYSIEHDLQWFEKVKQTISETNSNVELVLIEPKKIDLGQTEKVIRSGKDPRFINYDYKVYSEAILRFPQECFDLLLIDGRVRIECLNNSISRLKVGGILIFDNSDRYELSEILVPNQFQLILSKYELVENDLFFAESSIWRKLT